MITTVKFATTSTVHAARNGKTVCGSEVGRAAGAVTVTLRKTVACEGEVSCKRCMKLLAADPAGETLPKIDVVGRALRLIEGFALEANEPNLPAAEYTRIMRMLKISMELARSAGATREQIAHSRWIAPFAA